MSARMDDRQGLAFTGGLESLVELESLQSEGVGSEPMIATLRSQPSDGAGSMPLPGGRWEIGAVRAPTDDTPGSRITLRLVNGQDVVAGEVMVNLDQAEDLLMRVSGAVRAVRP